MGTARASSGGLPRNHATKGSVHQGLSLLRLWGTLRWGASPWHVTRGRHVARLTFHVERAERGGALGQLRHERVAAAGRGGSSLRWVFGDTQAILKVWLEVWAEENRDILAALNTPMQRTRAKPPGCGKCPQLFSSRSSTQSPQPGASTSQLSPGKPTEPLITAGCALSGRVRQLTPLSALPRSSSP